MRTSRQVHRLVTAQEKELMPEAHTYCSLFNSYHKLDGHKLILPGGLLEEVAIAQEEAIGIEDGVEEDTVQTEAPRWEPYEDDEGNEEDQDSEGAGETEEEDA